MYFRLIALLLLCASATASAQNAPPLILSEPPTSVTAPNTYRYEIQAYDPDAEVLQFVLVAAPAGATLDAADGILTWSVTSAEVGEHQIVLRAVDPASNFAEQTFTLTVRTNGSNQPPLITSSPVTSVIAGQLYKYAVTAYDPDVELLNFVVLEGPPGMTIDAETGQVSWQTAESDIGLLLVRLRVLDPSGNFNDQKFELSVLDPSGNRPPVITSTPPTRVRAGNTYTYTVQATDPDNDSLVYSLLQGPPGMQIDPQTGVITWTTTSADIGSHPVRVRVTDPAGNFDEQEWVIVVTDGDDTCEPSSCGNGTVEPECGEVCDQDIACGSASGAFARCLDGCTRLDRTACTMPPDAEICGNCIDDDGDGLTDFEDPGCCPQGTSTMVITKGILTPAAKGTRTKLRIGSRLVRSPVGAYDPLRQDVYFQLREAGKPDLICAYVPAAKFMRVSKRLVAYWGGFRPIASARGISDMAFRTTRDGNINALTWGQRVRFSTPKSGTLQVTYGFVTSKPAGVPNVCTTVSQPFQTKRKGLRAP